MRFISTLFLLIFGLCPALRSQTLVSSTLLGSRTRAQLVSQFGVPLIQYGVKYYRITYTTTDTQGLPDTVSGLVAVPDDATRIYPRLVYQHGTSSSRLDVPSFNVVNGGEGVIGNLFAGLGYVALLPDYLGLGVSDGFHPYVHAASEALVAADMLRALPAFAAQYGVHTNEQLFATGYSQGGHASMAFHREVETTWKNEFEMTAAAHLSGPYSIGEVMRDLILKDTIYYYPGYLPNTILSYQTAYGNLFTQLSEVFREPYATKIAEFYAGTLNLGSLNTQLITLLTTNEGDSRPIRMLQPAIIQAVLTEPNHPFNIALRDNNVYAWAPVTPTRIFYCMADDQVPFQNSVLARDSMIARGAANLIATDVNSAADHGGCVTPALTNTLIFFLSYQQVGFYTGSGQLAVEPLLLQPNPAGESVVLRNLPTDGQVQVVDFSGRLRYAGVVPAGDRVLDVSGLDNGLYLVRYLSEGKIWQGKLVVQR
ncbi:MAG: T9SS type A sorting domain-containing protein [Lewinellaceae bacterium]|nr:T9SS type A sorting domain-containing protein [Lewinellaceae bacterium]